MVFVWKQNYILVDEYFFFCCTWIVNSAAKKARQLRRETSSYGRTMNNEIAGLSSPSISILKIRLFTQPGINILFCAWEQP
ncbi:hypothetical protein, partial [Escherichia coli]